ncbi:MAG TPA: hypothetical protein VGL77_06885, partial [Armatimonadota bacterium]
MLSESDNDALQVKTLAMVWKLDAEQDVKAIRWRNLLTGDVLELGGGAELTVEIDHAESHVWIEGWHYQPSQREAVSPDEEDGYRAGYHRPDYPDISEQQLDHQRWQSSPGLYHLTVSGEAFHWQWARSRVFLPESLQGKPLTLTLGGFGVGDFRHTRVFMNGVL